MDDETTVRAVNQPEKKFRAGAIAATVWKNAAAEGSYRTVQFERTYKDKQGAWKKTNSLRVNDLPKASLVLQKAYEYLAFNDELAA